jgi:hypothetical protein
MSTIVIQYIGEVKCEFSEDRKNIEKIMIGDEKILWGCWSIFTEFLYKNKDMRCIFDIWHPNKNKWKFWKAGDWIHIAEHLGRITHEMTEDGKYFDKIFIGNNSILHNNCSIFQQYDEEVICLRIGEDKFSWRR